MKLSQLIASSFGNIIEWLDVGLFIYLAPIIGQQFFPSDNVENSTIIAFGVFAAGFLCRPFGSILFGHLGDRIGRVKTLIFSILTISFATLSVGFLPGYALIGKWAPIIFVILRLIQGISIGGEYTGIMVYLAETAPDCRRGFTTSFAAVGANSGFLLATIITILLKTCFPTQAEQTNVWRIPFIFSGLLGLSIFYLRLKLLESPTYNHLRNQNLISKIPLLVALRQGPRRLLQIFALTFMSASFYYVFFGYMPNYLEQYFNISLLLSLICQAISLTAMLILVPLAGKLGDLFGRKKILAVTAIAVILLTLPCLFFLSQGNPLLMMIGLGIATLISSLDQGNTLITVVENCPSAFRYSGVSFAYNLGMTVFGGTAPFIVGLLTKNINQFAASYYLAGSGILSLLVILTLQETYKIRNLYETS